MGSAMIGLSQTVTKDMILGLVPNSFSKCLRDYPTLLMFSIQNKREVIPEQVHPFGVFW